MRIRWADLFRIAMLAIMLFGVLMVRTPCAQGVARFIDSFSPPPEDGASPAPAPLPGPLRPLTDEQLRAHFRSVTADAGAR
jgi:hypothetical protein